MFRRFPPGAALLLLLLGACRATRAFEFTNTNFDVVPNTPFTLTWNDTASEDNSYFTLFVEGPSGNAKTQAAVNVRVGSLSLVYFPSNLTSGATYVFHAFLYTTNANIFSSAWTFDGVDASSAPQTTTAIQPSSSEVAQVTTASPSQTSTFTTSTTSRTSTVRTSLRSSTSGASVASTIISSGFSTLSNAGTATAIADQPTGISSSSSGASSPSITQTTTNSTAPTTELTTGAKAGIGVAVAVGGAAVIGAVIALVYRIGLIAGRRSRDGSETPDENDKAEVESIEEDCDCVKEFKPQLDGQPVNEMDAGFGSLHELNSQGLYYELEGELPELDGVWNMARRESQALPEDKF